MSTFEFLVAINVPSEFYFSEFVETVAFRSLRCCGLVLSAASSARFEGATKPPHAGCGSSARMLEPGKNTKTLRISRLHSRVVVIRTRSMAKLQIKITRYVSAVSSSYYFVY